MPSWTSLRVETPARRLSPGLRARTNMTRSPRRSGMFAVGRMVRVTHPSDPVACSGALYVHPYGRPSTNTSAPWTESPFESETWKRAGIGVVRDRVGFGEKWTPSITSRLGSETLLTEIVVTDC